MNTTSDKPKQSNRRSGIRTADKMYSVLASMGAGWHDHKAIAAAMNKAKLNASEFAALRALSSAGRIETQLVDATYFVKRWEYRVIVPPGAAE